MQSSPDARTSLSVILKGAFGSAVLKGVNLVFGLAATAFLGRVLLPEQYGYYSFASTTVTLLSMPVQCGLPQLMTREIAKYQFSGQWGYIRGLLLRANQLVGVLGALTIAVLLLLLPLLARTVPAVEPKTFLWAIVLLPLIAFNRLRGGALIGFRQVVLGMLPDNGIRAVLFLVLIVAWHALLPFNSADALALQVAATVVAFLSGTLLLMRALPPAVRHADASFNTKVWVKAIIPLTLTDALLIFNLQADLLVLGIFRDAAAVGIYRAAALVAMQITIVVTIANEVLAPHIARLHEARDHKGLQNLLRHAFLWLVGTAALLTGGCLIGGREVLQLVFGSAYAGGADALAILACGQFIAATAGIGSVVLNMSGHEKDVLRIFTVSALSNLVANVVLVPRFGLSGAAFATAGCQLFTNALLLFFVRRRLGILLWPSRSKG